MSTTGARMGSAFWLRQTDEARSHAAASACASMEDTCEVLLRLHCRRSGRPQQPSSPEPEPSSEEEEREPPEVTWRRRLAAEAAMDGREPTFAAGAGLPEVQRRHSAVRSRQ